MKEVRLSLMRILERQQVRLNNVNSKINLEKVKKLETIKRKKSVNM